MSAEGFFVVWSPTAGPPTKRHAYRDQAEAEAQRLAKMEPGKEFFVLLAVSVSTTPRVVTTALREPMPF